MMPGSGGEITNIEYRDLVIHNPLWWAIYIGPSGCMLYPIKECETQPLITIANIDLKNIVSKGGFLPPGIIRCNESNPCYGINFEAV